MIRSQTCYHVLSQLSRQSVGLISPRSQVRPLPGAFFIFLFFCIPFKPYKKKGAATGIEPVTSCTRNRNHTSRPSGHNSIYKFYFNMAATNCIHKFLKIIFLVPPMCPSWSKGRDLRSRVSHFVGSNPTVGRFFSMMKMLYFVL